MTFANELKPPWMRLLEHYGVKGMKWGVRKDREAELAEQLNENPLDRNKTYGGRPDRVRFSIPNERSIISSIYTRLSVDVSGGRHSTCSFG
jgi:hypothetical protein